MLLENRVSGGVPVFALSFFIVWLYFSYSISFFLISFFKASSLQSDAKKSHTSNPQYYLELCICGKKPNKPLSIVMFNSIYWFCKVHYGPSMKSQEKTPWLLGGIWGILRGLSKSSFTWKAPQTPVNPTWGSFQGVFPWASLTVHSVCSTQVVVWLLYFPGK